MRSRHLDSTWTDIQDGKQGYYWDLYLVVPLHIYLSRPSGLKTLRLGFSQLAQMCSLSLLGWGPRSSMVGLKRPLKFLPRK